LTKKTKKLTGKELAKINKRKKFYEKLERFYNRLEDDDEEVIFISMNKNFSFPEFDDLSKVLTKNFVELDQEIKMEDSKSIDMTYFEEAQFLLETSESKLLIILRGETKFDSDGNLLKGATSTSDDYNYQSTFNWAIKLIKNEKFGKMLAEEKINPTEYDLTPPKAVILDPFHYKSKKQPRRKRR
jgi:hypothetical protein